MRLFRRREPRPLYPPSWATQQYEYARRYGRPAYDQTMEALGMSPDTRHHGSGPVEIGQTRADSKGGTIHIDGFTPGRRYVVSYPQLAGEVHILGDATIEQLYPIVIAP